MNRFDRYYKAIHFLEGLNNLPLQGDYVIDKHHADIYLKRMRYFLELIGNPDKNINYIHIAGTSGKGTVTTMVHEILTSAGKNVGSFTSPSVSTSLEKIRVKDLYISPDEFADIVAYLKPFINKAYIEGPYGRPSYFEIFLAIAFVYFKQKKCEWVVLEVGLGGRFDATNVIEKPVVTAITNIDYDHTDILGKTLKKIAHDKAGIIKKGSVFFTTEQSKSILTIFKKICDEKKVPFNHLELPPHSSYNSYNSELSSAIAHHIDRDLKIDRDIKNSYIQEGIKNTRLMCRFEIMQSNPMVVLDGAHNRSKIKTTIENIEKLTFKKLYLIIGISDNKDHISILKQIVPYGDHIFFTRFQNKDRKCAHPKELLKKSKKYLKKSSKTYIDLDAEHALDEALKKAGDKDLIVVAGSFFLAGELRKRWISEEEILEKRKGFK